MTELLSDVARIEAEIAATKERIGRHLDDLKAHLHPVEIVQDVAAAGLAAAKELPKNVSPKTVLGVLAALGGIALLMTLRGSIGMRRPALPQPS